MSSKLLAARCYAGRRQARVSTHNYIPLLRFQQTNSATGLHLKKVICPVVVRLGSGCASLAFGWHRSLTGQIHYDNR